MEELLKDKKEVLEIREYLEKNRSSSSFMEVVDSPAGDDSICTVHPTNMEKLQCFRGDTMKLSSKKSGMLVHSIILANENSKPSMISVTSVTRRNLGVEIGDTISVKSENNMKYSSRVSILPFRETIPEGYTGNLFNTFLRPYFLEAYRPVTKNSLLRINGANITLEFLVVEIQDNDGDTNSGIVAPDTIIHVDGDPIDGTFEDLINRSSENSKNINKKFDNLKISTNEEKNEILKIKRCLDLRFKYPSLLDEIKMSDPNGMIICCPSLDYTNKRATETSMLFNLDKLLRNEYINELNIFTISMDSKDNERKKLVNKNIVIIHEIDKLFLSEKENENKETKYLLNEFMLYEQPKAMDKISSSSVKERFRSELIEEKVFSLINNNNNNNNNKNSFPGISYISEIQEQMMMNNNNNSKMKISSIGAEDEILEETKKKKIFYIGITNKPHRIPEKYFSKFGSFDEKVFFKKDIISTEKVLIVDDKDGRERSLFLVDILIDNNNNNNNNGDIFSTEYFFSVKLLNIKLKSFPKSFF